MANGKKEGQLTCQEPLDQIYLIEQNAGWIVGT